MEWRPKSSERAGNEPLLKRLLVLNYIRLINLPSQAAFGIIELSKIS
jgi:hypothetical protein